MPFFFTLHKPKNCFDFNEVNFGSCSWQPHTSTSTFLLVFILEKSLYPFFVIEIFIVVAQFGISGERKWKEAAWDKLLSAPGAFFKTISSVYHSHPHNVPFALQINPFICIIEKHQLEQSKNIKNSKFSGQRAKVLKGATDKDTLRFRKLGK